MTSIKLEFRTSKEVRRFAGVNFEQLVGFARDGLKQSSVVLQYEDDDKDLVTIGSENELIAALRYAAGKNPPLKTLRVFASLPPPSASAAAPTATSQSQSQVAAVATKKEPEPVAEPKWTMHLFLNSDVKTQPTIVAINKRGLNFAALKALLTSTVSGCARLARSL